MKITAKEIAAIHALLTCDYATDVSGDPRSPDHAGHYVWAWCVDGAGLGRGAGGVVASLKRKGLVDCSGFGKEAATAVTAAGLAAYLEHGAEDADVAASWAARDARVAARATAAAEAHAEEYRANTAKLDAVAVAKPAPLRCANCDGGLDGSDLAYGLVCHTCGVRVAGPFTSANDVPEYVATTESERIEQATRKFPTTFGLRGHDGTFRFCRHASYVNDANMVTLYTQRLVDGAWLDFAKGSVAEFEREVVQHQSDAPALWIEEIAAAAEDVRDETATSEPVASGPAKLVSDAIGFKIVHTDGRTDTIQSGGFDGYGDACDAVGIVYRGARRLRTKIGHAGGLLDGGDHTLVLACAADLLGDDGFHEVAKIVAVMPTWFDATCPYCGKCGEHSHDIQDLHYPDVRS